MNSTIRTANRVVFFFGALLAGSLATVFGFSVSIGAAALVFAAAALVILFSPLRTARHDDDHAMA
jgi:fatty acid desaturase